MEGLVSLVRCAISVYGSLTGSRCVYPWRHGSARLQQARSRTRLLSVRHSVEIAIIIGRRCCCISLVAFSILVEKHLAYADQLVVHCIHVMPSQLFANLLHKNCI